MINLNIKQYLNFYKKPNYFFIIFTFLCLLNNSIFSLNENFSIIVYCAIFIFINSNTLKFKLYKIDINRDVILTLLIIIIPSLIFIILRFKNGISFRGDEIAHYSNSITNLSYWVVPQYYENGLIYFLKNADFSMMNMLNMKIINLVIFLLINIFFFINFKKLFNLILFISTLILVYHQNSFPYEYAQGTFFTDNLTQIILYKFFPYSISESVGLSNFIFFIIYLLILRPLIINENLFYKDIKIFGILLIFPSLNLLIFSNYQEGMALIFVLLAIENFYKYKDFKTTSILFAISGCFREVFFLPIFILFIIDQIINKKKFFKNNIFYLTVISPFLFHLLHVTNNPLGQKKIDFLYKIQNLLFDSFHLNNVIIFKLFLIIIPIFISLFLFYKSKDNKFIILLLLNFPIILILFLRHNLSFMDINRFFYIWVMFFYFYILLEFSKLNYHKYFAFFLIIIIYMNNFSFLYKYYNLEINFDPSTNLILPIKTILQKNKDYKKLQINTNISINKFGLSLYPNLQRVNFIKKDTDNYKCNCEKDYINIYILDNIKSDKDFCKFSGKNNCSRTYLYKNKLYQVHVFK